MQLPHKGLNRARTGERLKLLTAESQARKSAVVAECDKRLTQHPIGLCDCADIRALGCRIDWGRKNGRIYARFRVVVMPSAAIHDFLWSLPGDKASTKTSTSASTRDVDRTG
jgi:hypothetical protein